MKKDPCCDFCFEPLAVETSYRLVAWEFMGTELDGPEFSYELCRQCYYEACRTICDLISRILALQAAKLKAHAVGLEI